MANFNYTAKSSDGNTQKGTIVAGTQVAAIAALTKKGLQPIVVKEVKREFKSIEIKLPGSSKVKAKDLVIFTRQFATMINAGVPMVRSLSTLTDQTASPALRSVLEKVVAKVEGGVQLSDTLAEYPKVFSEVYINMVRAGESGGILDQIMERLATQVEKDAEIKGKLKSALIYPGVITFITIGAFVFIMTAIIPKLAAIFEQFDGELPLQTKVMLGISDFMVNNGILLFIMVAVAIFLFVRFVHTERGKFLFDTFLLKIPVFGKIILKINVARFARTFSSLTSAGVSVLDGLEVTSGSISNTVIQKGIRDSVQKIKNGQPISQSIAETNIFPPILTQMTAVGEETGQVDVVLEKVAEFYEKEVDRIISGLTSIIEPVLILVLGGLVGTIVASVFGPISSLSQNI